MSSIQKEKSIADAVLERLEILDPTAILAGGAPRDWCLDKTANDLDFYIYSRANTPTLEHSLAMLGLQATPMHLKGRSVQANLEDLYGAMPDLRAVYETTYRGKKVQIMVMNNPTFRGVVDKFACSISKVWYKNGDIYTTWAAETAFVTRNIVVEKGYTINHRYVDKMMKRFPDYQFTFQMDGGRKTVDQLLQVPSWYDITPFK